MQAKAIGVKAMNLAYRTYPELCSPKTYDFSVDLAKN
jgi:hypothetical protein